MKVRWTRRSVEDLKRITRYISADDPRAARRFAETLRRKAESACRLPKRGRMVPELGRRDVRELIEGNYRIVYRILDDAVDILTLFEGHKPFDGLEHPDR